MAAADIKLLTSTGQECGKQSSLNDGNQIDAGSALSSPATETRETIDPEPQHLLAKETSTSIAYSTQTNGLDSLDCRGLCGECSILIYLFIFMYVNSFLNCERGII